MILFQRLRLLIVLLSIFYFPVLNAAVTALDTGQVGYQAVKEVYRTDAVIEAINQATVSAQTTGRIVEINFDVDDFVPKDSVIMRFRDTKQKAALDQARSALKEAEVRMTEAKQEFDRIEDVYKKKLVAKSQYDKAKADHEAAVQNLDQAKARLVQAQEDMDRTIVKAPYAGIVVKRHVQLGETAKVGQALMTGFSMDAVRAIATVPQRKITAIRPENPAYISFDNISFDNKTGTVRTQASRVSINPYGDAQTHTYSVRLYFKGGVENLMPGMNVKAEFVTGENRRLLVPGSAVTRRGELTAVYTVAESGKLSFQQIRAGNEVVEGYVEVLSGLAEGDKVALDPSRAVVLLKEQQSGN